MIVKLIRFVLSIILLVFIYKETGICTTLAIALTMLSVEVTNKNFKSLMELMAKK